MFFDDGLQVRLDQEVEAGSEVGRKEELYPELSVSWVKDVGEMILDLSLQLPGKRTARIHGGGDGLLKNVQDSLK